VQVLTFVILCNRG